MADDKSNLITALGLMETALGLLDEAGNAAEVGAHLDLAIHRLGNLVAAEPRDAEDDVRLSSSLSLSAPPIGMSRAQ